MHVKFNFRPVHSSSWTVTFVCPLRLGSPSPAPPLRAGGADGKVS